MTLNSVLLQTAGSGWTSMLMIVVMIVIFYFFMIRPQSKKQKELKRQRDAMQKGDRVVTAGGIHGKIRSVEESTIMIEIAPEVVIKLDKASVYPVVEATSKEKK